LFNAGFKSIRDIRRASLLELSKILGEGIAKSVKNELAGDMD